MVKVGEEVEIVGFTDTRKVVVTGVEMFRKLLDQGQAGDNIGALLRGIEKHEIERGQVLAKPGSVTPHTKFEGEVYVLKKEEGGRHTPFFTNYRPQFYMRTTDVTGTCHLPEGTKMVMPGDNTKMTIEIDHAGGARGAAAVRDPRGRTHRRRRHRHEDPGVEEATWPQRRRFASASRRSITSCSTSRPTTSSRRRSARARAWRGPSRCRRTSPLHGPPRAARRQEVARAVRNPHPQAAARHPRPDPADARRADEARPLSRRRRRDQELSRRRRWQRSTSST